MHVAVDDGEVGNLFGLQFQTAGLSDYKMINLPASVALASPRARSILVLGLLIHRGADHEAAGPPLT